MAQDHLDRCERNSIKLLSQPSLVQIYTSELIIHVVLQDVQGSPFENSAGSRDDNAEPPGTGLDEKAQIEATIGEPSTLDDAEVFTASLSPKIPAMKAEGEGDGEGEADDIPSAGEEEDPMDRPDPTIWGKGTSESEYEHCQPTKEDASGKSNFADVKNRRQTPEEAPPAPEADGAPTETERLSLDNVVADADQEEVLAKVTIRARCGAGLLIKRAPQRTACEAI
eukprot:506700-Prorocentrum_minimum.AAC.1